MADDRDLTRTIAWLRHDMPMRDDWRAGVMREIEACPRAGFAPRTEIDSPRDWRLRPAMALVAGLVCAMVGGGVTLGVQRLATASRATVAESGATGAARDVPVRFVFVAPAASKVTLVGDFNSWVPTATPLRRTTTGLWSVDVPLPPGRHTYSFVVDGQLVADPNALGSADDDYGVPSSVVLVSNDRRL
jgi:hypothetical protein